MLRRAFSTLCKDIIAQLASDLLVCNAAFNMLIGHNLTESCCLTLHTLILTLCKVLCPDLIHPHIMFVLSPLHVKVVILACNLSIPALEPVKGPSRRSGLQAIFVLRVQSAQAAMVAEQAVQATAICAPVLYMLARP